MVKKLDSKKLEGKCNMSSLLPNNYLIPSSCACV